jgi:DNA-binding response OmpR family regulator
MDDPQTVLLVDDNRDLLHFFARQMAEAGWKLLTAESASGARKLLNSERPNAVLLDYMLPDGNGIKLGVQLRQNAPRMHVIVMTGSVLPPEDEAICEEQGFIVLRKPFLAGDIMDILRSRPPAAKAAPQFDLGAGPLMDNPFVSGRVLLEILHCLQRIEAKLDLLAPKNPD